MFVINYLSYLFHAIKLTNNGTLQEYIFEILRMTV